MRVTDEVPDAERCRLPAATLEAVDVEVGQQVRLRYEGKPAVFTVGVADGTFGAVNPDGRDRLGAKGDGFRAGVDPTVVEPSLEESTAAREGGFLERRLDAERTRVAALAPHGGYIEYGTDLQARRVAERLDATAWYCAGWWPSGGAFDRWHVTSTDIHPGSFPELRALADREVTHAVSFHGWTESHLAVGGGAPRERREAVRDALADAVDGIEVRLAEDDARDGSSPENVVNWIPSLDGIQLEQPFAAREEYDVAIADAVADVLADL